MVDFRQYFDYYCAKNNINLQFSTNMPSDYEAANGTFDVALNTLFLNVELLVSYPEYQQLFYLFHEFCHAL